MKKIYLLFLTLLAPICFWGQTTTETFETATSKATTFTSNGQVFTITTQSNGPFSMNTTYPGTGWNGTANDNVYIDNDVVLKANTACGFTISKATAFKVNSFYLFLSGANLNLNVSGTLTVVGKLAGSTVFTATKTSPFNNTNINVSNGYTLIDMTTFGGANNSTASIDQLVITTTSSMQYVALDAFKWTTSANTAPTDIALSATAVNENVAASSTVGALTSTDANAGDTFTYSLVAGTGSTDNASFAISGSNLQIVSSPNFETKSSYAIRVRTTDSGGLTFEKQYTITVNNINEVPTDIALSATAVNENVVANTVVGTLSTTDPDSANTFTYSLVAGAGSGDNASFAISGNNLQIVSSPNFETKSSYALRVRTSDQGGMSFEKQFTVTINNLNETPTDITLSASTLNENVAANSVVGALTSTDPDAANTFTYTLVAGTGSTDNASFSISGGNLQIVSSPDFETKSSYAIRVRTTDQGTLFFEKQFTVTINNVNETPTDIALSATSINENVAANSTVGALTTTDVDAANTFTYTLVAGTGSTDNASFNISGGNLRITNSPDFETKNSYSIRVRTTDQGTLNSEKQFTITINNVNESVPTILSITTDSGTNTTDFITNDNTLTINGTAEVGSTITMSINGGAVPSGFATATTNGSGVYSIAFPTAFPYTATLADNTYSIIITSTLNSVPLSSASKNITVDTAASIAITTPVAGNNVIENTESTNLTLSGTSTLESGRTVTITISNGVNPNVVTTTTTTTGGAWTKTGINVSTLNDGSLTITAAASDIAGNNATIQENGVTLSKATLSTIGFEASKTSIVVYPNPVSSILTIVNSENSIVESIEVIGANGQIVANAKNSNTIDVSNLVSGVYFVKINSGNHTEIKKIIKK